MTRPQRHLPPQAPHTPIRLLALAGVLSLGVACDSLSTQKAPQPRSSAASNARLPPAAPGNSALPKELANSAPEDAGAVQPKEPPPHEGPWFVVTSLAASIYGEAKFDRKNQLGYARSGAKIPVNAGIVSKEQCSGGWYALVDGGYVCGNQGSVDPKDSKIRFTMKQPDLEAVLPYRYARNAKNGTPLYRSIPSREQMLQYEPYLDETRKPASADAGAPEPEVEHPTPSVDGGSSRTRLRNKLDQALSDAGLDLPIEDEPSAEPEVAWWQKENAHDTLHEVTLDQLESEADGILAKRMVKGFYVAVDKTFSWNKRAWYKTTKGLIAPQDRLGYASGSEFKGTELGTEHQLPVGWVYGWRKSTSLYEIDLEKKNVKTSGSADQFELLDLTGRTTEIREREYHETVAGKWVRTAHIRVAQPAPPPDDIGPAERWVDVNLAEQTLVAFEGAKPVYATLVSSGKSSKIKAKDHRTPTGEWRVREKHLTTTMDGDGTAAGDLPYSIEDVPYVMYYYRSYALHGAFWHRNYGVQMSHGCVNLAPLDAKWVFFFTGPALPRGWHGVWSSDANPGARVVVHNGEAKK